MRISADAPFVEVLDATFFQMRFLDAPDAVHAAQSPEGRWHHSGQRALYLSGTPEGTKVAMRIYRRDDESTRAIFLLKITNARVINIRNAKAPELYGIDASEMHCRWQEHVRDGKPSPTWQISDAIRAAGFDGLLAPSRSAPDLTHLTLFRWNEPNAHSVTLGPPVSQA